MIESILAGIAILVLSIYLSLYISTHVVYCEEKWGRTGFILWLIGTAIFLGCYTLLILSLGNPPF